MPRDELRASDESAGQHRGNGCQDRAAVARRRARLIAAAPSASALGGCSGGEGGTTAASAPDSAAPARFASASAASVLRTEELSVDHSMITAHRALKVVRYHPKSPQKGQYTTYEFERDAFVQVVGSDAPQADVKLKVEILEERTETRNSPSPSDTSRFTVLIYKARAIEVIE